MGLDTNNFFLAKSMKEGNGCVNDFFNNNNNNDNGDVNVNVDVNVIKVINNGEQSPNNGFIDLDLAELIPHVAN